MPPTYADGTGLVQQRRHFDSEVTLRACEPYMVSHVCDMPVHRKLLFCVQQPRRQHSRKVQNQLLFLPSSTVVECASVLPPHPTTLH